jgi:diadenosine tetraphosphate (Ap4A) HIT family hydrolase
VIPTGAYVSLADFTDRASDAEIAGFWRAVGRTAEALGLVDGGYRVLSNAGGDSHQEVPHLHVHVFGGAALGPMLARRSGGGA